MRTFSYRPRKVRLAGAAVLATAIAALLGGLFRLTDGAARTDEGPHHAGPAAVAEIRIEVGRDYPVELSTHCGLTVTEFAGRRWKAERAGAARPDRERPVGDRGRAPVTPGVMRLLDVDTLRFTAADNGLVVVFRPTREAPPACT